MLSMTGFGAATVPWGPGAVTVQVGSVNSKGLTVTVRGDLRDLVMEEAVRRQAREALARGSVTVHVAIATGRALAIDRERLGQAWRELSGLAHELGAPSPALEHVAGLPGLGRAGGEDAGLGEAVQAATARALADVQAARAREGRALLADCLAHARELARLHREMGPVAAARLPKAREALAARVREALAGSPIPDEALAREIALIADRLDVAEELTRLAAHLDALEQLLAGPDDGLGRKLDFLLQEVGREINTTGSKSNDVALTRLVLAAKGLLEQLKEQAANVA
jgi:uncharacterized protein (TIGR00255 family)